MEVSTAVATGIHDRLAPDAPIPATMPSAKRVATIDVPPEETSGRLRPVSGNTRNAPPQMRSSWRPIKVATVSASSARKPSAAFVAAATHRQTIVAPRASTAAAPNHPHWAPTPTKMKSEWISGTRAATAGLPWPTIPPAARPYSAYTNWNPLPIGSRQGSSQPATRSRTLGAAMYAATAASTRTTPAGASDNFDLRTDATAAYAPTTTSAAIPRSFWKTSTATAERTAPTRGSMYGAGGRSNEPSRHGAITRWRRS